MDSDGPETGSKRAKDMPNLRSRNEATNRKSGPEKQRPQRRPDGEGADERFAGEMPKPSKRRSERRDDNKDQKPQERKVASRTKAGNKEHPKPSGKSGRGRARASLENAESPLGEPPAKKPRRINAAHLGAADPTAISGGSEDPAASTQMPEFGAGIMEKDDLSRLSRNLLHEVSLDTEEHSPRTQSEEPEQDYGDPPAHAAVRAAKEANDHSNSDSNTDDSSQHSPTESESPPAASLPEIQVQRGPDSRSSNNLGSLAAVYHHKQRVIKDREGQIREELAELLKEKLQCSQTLRMITTVKKEIAAKEDLQRQWDSHPNRNVEQASPVSPPG